MPVHYSQVIGIPYCGDGVIDESGARHVKWKADPVPFTRKRVVTPVETTSDPNATDCPGLIPRRRSRRS